MNKIYLVTYKSENGVQANLDKIKEQLRLLGDVTEWVNTRRIFLAYVFTADEKLDAVAIRNKLKECINPFEEGVAALEVNEWNIADTDMCKCIEFKRSPRSSYIEKNEPRNFSRFKTRHEAFVAYDMERPVWVYPDNIGNAIVMDINEWLWMPIKKGGQYERGKYDKYLG